MLPLPSFEVVRARTLDEALEALSGPPGEAMPLAGGTDVVPNLKHGLFAPRRLVALRRVEELGRLALEDDGTLAIGAGVTLARLAREPLVVARHPALARAASLVASPQIRSVATLGGNVCLPPRCRFYNQTAFWRGALGGCLRKDGDVCHVVPKGRTCVAAASSDTPGPLIAYGAKVRIAGARGAREIPLADVAVADGTQGTSLAPDEIVTAIVVPPPARGLRSAYRKLAPRAAIDFPVLSIALAVRVGDGDRIDDLALVVGALAAKPRLVTGLDQLARGEPLSHDVVEAVAKAAYAQCRPLTNLDVDPAWRREVLPELVRRAFGDLRSTSVPPC